MLQSTTATPPNACLECRKRFHHIGADGPAPECPACDSPVVTPIGDLTVESVEELDVKVGVDSQFWRIATTDATARTFTFMYGVGERSRELVWLVVSIDDGDVHDQYTVDVTDTGPSFPREQLPLDAVEGALDKRLRRRKVTSSTAATTESPSSSSGRSTSTSRSSGGSGSGHLGGGR